MAANCGYHSPQFSEDITWLPAWLQPHHPPPNLGDSAKDEQAISCKSHCNDGQNEASFKENTSNGQGGLLFTNDNAKYSNCHLYFSGEDNSPAESTPGQALHFCLNLSSVGTSLISSGQLNEVPQIGNCEANGSSFMKYLETPEVHGDTSYLCKMNDAPASESPVGCKPRRSPILISQALIKGDQNNQQRFQEKLDHDNLGSVDIDVEVLQTGKYENEGSSWEHIPETPAVQNDTRCQFKMNNGPPVSDMSPVGGNQIPVSEPVTKADQNNCHRFHGKIDAGKLKTANIDDAVELSIAASEAMVISEIVSSSFPSELLPATTILEIALRVRQARNQCYSDISEADSGISDKLDETDQLCDLDEDIMADAFDDVGLSVTQSVGTPLFPLQQQILQSTFSCDLHTHVSESNCGCKDEAQRNHLRSHNVEINRTTSQTNNAFSCKLESNNLLLEHLAVQQTKSTFLLPMGYNTSCLRNQPMAHTLKLIHNVDDLTAIQMDSKDDPAILKESKVTPERGANLKKSMEEFFNGESSFISESVDDMDECTPELGLEAEPDIVASSSTPFGDLIKHTYNESERSIHEGLFSSDDIVRSSILSLADPLCSIVPCSISSYDDPMKKTEESGKKFINSTAIVRLQNLNIKSLGLQNLNTKTIVPNPQVSLPSTPLDQGGDCVLSKIRIEGSGVPRRKQFSSLKPYSMVMPCHKTAGEIIYQNKWGSLHSMDEKITHLFPTEENTNCFACDKDELRFPLKSMYKCVVVDGPNNSLDLGSKGHENVNGSYAIGKTEDADIGMPAQCSEERSSPLILNKKKCRLEACKIILNCDGEDETFKVSSASNLRKFRLENSMNEISGKDQTNITSCDPQQSYLGSYAANKHLLSDKKVHFLEPKTSIDRTKTGGRPQSGYNICSSQRRTRKKAKECSLRCKIESRKELYNSLKRWSMIRGKGMILQGLEFLLTGFSSQKEKELEALIRKYGGYVLSNIPSPNLRGKRRVATASLKLPIVLSPKKVHTTKFLYGCATNTWILNANWLVDSVQAGSVLPPGKYMTRPIQSSMRSHVTIGEPLCFDNGTFIFDRVGVMLYGKASFCTKFSQIVKHGGGQVFKSLQLLVQSLENGKNTVGAIVVENEHCVSRHLEYCALEHNLQTVPAIWIINSLFSGKLLPFKKDRCAPLHRIKMPTFPCVQAMEMSEEI